MFNQINEGQLQIQQKKIEHYCKVPFLMEIQIYLSFFIFSKNKHIYLIISTSTASIEELSNQSIQNPRNIASKEKITLPTIITPFRTKVTEFVGSSNLLSNERFSEEIALNSGMADILTSKSSLIKSFEKDRRKSPLFEEAAQGERIDDIPPINLENVIND